MRRAAGALVALSAALVALSAALGALAAAPAGALRPALARLVLVEPRAEISVADAGWRRAAEGAAVSVGEAVRVDADSLARLELPWMAVTLGGDALLRFPSGFLLSARLEGGRALLESESRDIMKLVTPEGELRGRGRAVVRRRDDATVVCCRSGRFELVSPAGAVSLGPGQGSVALARRAPAAPRPGPEPPQALWPGRDPVYVGVGEPLELRWQSDAASYVVELLPVGSDVVLLLREVKTRGVRLAIPWHGAYRWRVAACDALGLEGAPSEEGMIAVE